MYSRCESSISYLRYKYLLVCGLSFLSHDGIFWWTKDPDCNVGKYNNNFLYSLRSCVFRNPYIGGIGTLSYFLHFLHSGYHLLVGRRLWGLCQWVLSLLKLDNPPSQLLSFSIGVISYFYPPYWAVTRDFISLSPNCDSCNAWNVNLSSLWLLHFLPSYLFFSLAATMGSQPYLHLARFLPSLSDLIILALMFSKKLFRRSHVLSGFETIAL